MIISSLIQALEYFRDLHGEIHIVVEDSDG